MIRKYGVLVFLLVICAWAGFPGPGIAATEVDPSSAGERTISLKVDQSILVDSEFNVKRVSVARPEIADVEVVSPRQLLVIGKGAGTTTLIYWSDEEKPSILEVNVAIAVERIRDELQRLAPNETFDLLAAGDTLILSGTVSSALVDNQLVGSAQAYAKNVVDLLNVEKLEQILVQIRVSEVDRSLAKELGFNMMFEHNSIRGSVSPPGSFSPFFGDFRADNIGDVGPNTSFSDAMNLFVAKPGAFPKFAGFLRLLHDKGALRTLAEPNLVVANGAEGKFLVGGEFPIVYTTSAGGTSSFAIQYKEFGVKLNFRPRISPNGNIYMNVAQEVSELDFANAVVLAGFQIPALRSRKAESGLQLADGQTFVLAGLLDNKISKQVTKLPLLGDIPILGALFRSTRYSNDETELMVMVTPKIVRPLNPEEIPSLPSELMESEETSPALIPMPTTK